MKLLGMVVENFRTFERVDLDFADETIIRAMNAKGKSTVLEAISWCLYGTDARGKSKMDGNLLRRGAKEMAVLTAWEKADGAAFTVQRIKGKGKSAELVNGHNAVAGEINGLFFSTVQEFLSVFLPGFFSGLEPKEAKAILARYSDVSPDEVYQTLMAKEKEALGPMTLGMGFDSIEVIRKKAAEQKKEAEAEKLRLEGEVRLADDALKAGEPKPFTSKITDAHRSTALQYRQSLAEYDVNVKNRAQTIQTLTKQKELLGKTFETLRAGLVAVETIETTCPTCKQSLPHEHLEAVKVNVVAKNHELKEKINDLITQGNEIKAEIERLQTTDAEPEHITKMREWLTRFDAGEQQERNEKAAYDVTLKTYNAAKATLAKRGEWIAKQDVIIQQAAAKLDAVKSFRFNYVKAQQHKLDKMFDKVKIILSKVNEDGEIKEEFLITWNGKPYQILSKSEKVRCDIEIGKAIAALRMNAEPMPVFVDDAEGVQRLFDEQFAGQVIAAYVFDSELIVKSYDDTVNDIEDELRSFQTLVQKKGA